jgi:hypothetical protein
MATAMSVDDPDLVRIAMFCEGDVSYRIDGSHRLVLMQGLRFLAAGVAQKMDALLGLDRNNATYPTKLYLEKQLGGGLNWNEEAQLLARKWYSYSWKDVPNTLPLFDILAAHLAALNPPRP